MPHWFKQKKCKKDESRCGAHREKWTVFWFVGNPFEGARSTSFSDYMIQNALLPFKFSAAVCLCVFYLHRNFNFSILLHEWNTVMEFWECDGCGGLSFLSGKNFDIFACEKTFAEIYYLLRMNTSFSIHKHTESEFFRFFLLHLLLLVLDWWW